MTDKKEILVKDFGYSVQNEFIMAQKALPGYRRTFYLPPKIEGFDYKITTIGQVLIINYTENDFALAIPSFSGSIKKGNNTLIKVNDSIILI